MPTKFLLIHKDFGQYIVVKTLSKRIAFLTVCAFFMMNINIFFAGLTSTLTVDLVENPIESLDDLLAKRAKYQIVTYAGYKKLHRNFCAFSEIE